MVPNNWRIKCPESQAAGKNDWMIYECHVDDDLAFSESEKPRYLLPEGCKDLYDVIRQQELAEERRKQTEAISAALEKLAGMATKPQTTYEDLSGALKKHWQTTSKELPLSIRVPDPVTVGALADMLHVKAYVVIAALVKFHIFASADDVLPFAKASQVCTYFGVAVTKAEGS